mgnify:CR=1 FL=1
MTEPDIAADYDDRGARAAHAVLQGEVDAHRLAGVSAATMRHGQLIDRFCTGLADIERGFRVLKDPRDLAIFVAMSVVYWSANGLVQLVVFAATQVVFAPMIVIRQKRNDPKSIAVIKRLPEFHSVIFVSKNAVDFGIELIRAQKQSLDHCQVYAVGVGSASRLRELGVMQVHTPHAEFTSEGLLKLPGLSSHQIDDEKVLIMRGAGGRELLAQTLAHRGAPRPRCGSGGAWR